MTVSNLSSVPLWLASGALMGCLYWATLRWSVAGLAAGRSVALAIVSQFLRFGALGATLAVVAARSGALALAASAGGLILARAVVIRLTERN